MTPCQQCHGTGIEPDLLDRMSAEGKCLRCGGSGMEPEAADDPWDDGQDIDDDMDRYPERWKGDDLAEFRGTGS